MSDILKVARTFLGKHGRLILTGTAIAGTITTAVVASRDTIRAQNAYFDALDVKLDKYDENLTKLEVVKTVAPCYIPTMLTAGATITAIVGAHTTGTSKIAAYSSAYTMAQEAAHLYRNKVREVVGEQRAAEIDERVGQAQVERSKDTPANVIVGTGEALCMDGFSGRYFTSTMERIRKAQNDLNYKLLNEVYASLNDWYEYLDLDPIGAGDELGWTSNHQLDLSFSSTLTEGGHPCLVINFRNEPLANYRNLH